MRIAITGASGFVGRAVHAALSAAGHTVVTLSRHQPSSRQVAAWDPATGDIDAAALGIVDAVVHLAGENVAAGRWKEARKKAILDSRAAVTRQLCRHLAAMQQRPRVLVCASATGFYGDRGDELLDETSAAGTGFLADVVRQWEAATAAASEAGIRVVNLRIGMVLDAHGGALQRMRLPFRLGLGGRLGSGRQWISWITRRDLVRVVERALIDDELRGPVLAVAPSPVQNREFTQSLGRALSRPTFLPVPAFMLRLIFGEMADELLLTSQRAKPQILLRRGFVFEDPELGNALDRALRSPA